MYKLVISDDEGRTTVVPLVRDEITIGREEGNTIRLTERNVSRKHARLSRVEARFVLSDTGSHNGIKLNGARMAAEVGLASGDQIVIGDYRIAFEAEQADSLSDEVAAGLPTPHDLVPPARLVMLSQPAAGAEFALSKDIILIGRDEVMDVWVNHRSVSREHAKITRTVRTEAKGEVVSFEVHDLDSANGVRVNGHEVFESELKEGDILELGQVSFRYVGLGEVFSFESGGSVPPSATLTPHDEEPDERSRLPIIAAVLILGVAIGLAVAIATSGSRMGGAGSNVAVDDPPPVAQTARDAPEDAAVAPASIDADAAGAESQEQARAALDACRQSLTARNAGVAVAAAERALVLVPGFPGAEQCRVEGARLRADLVLFSRGKEQLAANDIDAAYATMEQLSPGSELRSAPEFAATRLAFATQQVALARSALAGRPDAAAFHAQQAIRTDGIPETLVSDAQRILTAARRSSPAGRSPATSPSDGAVVGRPSMAADPVEPPRPAGSQNPMETARECLSLGDNRCVVAALEGGRATTPASLALLIETYRHMGDHEASRRHMRVFVRRYPTDHRTPAYSAALRR